MAVISEPDRSAASITTTPRARPEISRLRRGKWRGSGAMPSGISETSAPSRFDLVIEALVLGRIDDVDAAGDDCHRAGVDGALVGGVIDPARQARNDHESAAAEIGGETASRI